MSWGKGWEVGVRKAIWQHDKAQQRAAEILATECGKPASSGTVGAHETGTRTDLCPKCQAYQTPR